jgi:uncharacterized membrane protein
MSRADLDLKAAAGLALVAVVTSTTVDTSIVRTLPAVLLFLLVPGYVLSVVLFPEPRELLERVLVAVGLSLCIDVLGGLLLDRLGVGLTSRSWSSGLAVFTLAACGAAHRRRTALAGPSGAAADRSREARIRRPSLAATAMVVGSVAAVVAALLIARLPAGSAHIEGYTALWIKPTDSAAGTFSVGVRSDELRTTRFRLIAISLSGPRLVLRRNLTLTPGQQWQSNGSVRIPPSGSTEVRISLYKLDNVRVAYRQVYATFGRPGA